MSIQCLKKKGVINYGSNRSGKPPGGIWLPQGPFGMNGFMAESSTGPVGFSINGGRRNVGYVGQSMAMSKNGTPFYGQFAKGSGGVCGRYPRQEPVFNAAQCRVLGDQGLFIKQSVLSNKGMLERKYKWIHNGQYPNYWVQPVYPNSNLSDNASQMVYIQKKAAANILVNDTNRPLVYSHNYKKGGSTGCSTTTARYNSYNIMSANGLYTKTLGIPQIASQYTLQVQRKCAVPKGPLKPFPYAVNGGSSGANTTPGPPPPILTQNYTSPPDWYTKSC
jgi:hypothetical protein